MGFYVIKDGGRCFLPVTFWVIWWHPQKLTHCHIVRPQAFLVPSYQFSTRCVIEMGKCHCLNLRDKLPNLDSMQGNTNHKGSLYSKNWIRTFTHVHKQVSIEFLFRGKGNIEKLVKSLMQRHGKKIKKIRPSIVQRTPAIKSFNFLAKRTVGGCHATITTHPWWRHHVNLALSTQVYKS